MFAPQMRVKIWWTSPDLGSRRGDGRCRQVRRVGSWQSQGPTWPWTALSDEPHVRTTEVMGGQGRTEHGREPLKAPLRRERTENVGEKKVVRNVGMFVSMRVKAEGGGKTGLERMEQEGEHSRSQQSPTSMEDSRDGCHCSRCGGRSDGSSSQEHTFSKPLMEDPDE